MGREYKQRLRDAKLELKKSQRKNYYKILEVAKVLSLPPEARGASAVWLVPKTDSTVEACAQMRIGARFEMKREANLWSCPANSRKLLGSAQSFKRSHAAPAPLTAHALLTELYRRHTQQGAACVGGGGRGGAGAGGGGGGVGSAGRR